MSNSSPSGQQADDPQSTNAESARQVATIGVQRPLRITSREEAMAQLSQLSGLVLARIVTTPQATSIKGVLGTIIAAHDRDRQQESAGAISPELVSQLRRHPELANSLAAFLPQGMIDRLMQGDE